jgi:hypothetical protein
MNNNDNVNLLNEGNETDAQKAIKPEGLPDKFWDADKGEIRMEALVKSYVNLEKRMSGSIPEPKDDETRERFLRAAGVPATPDEYSVSIKDELFEPDTELNKRLHAKGFNSEQVQEVYDLAVEQMVPMILDMAAEFQAEREIERLISHFGSEDKWREASRQMLTFGQKNLPAPVLEGLSSSYEGIMALNQMMGNKEPSMMADKNVNGSHAGKDLESMMRDPKYWKDKDPAFIAKVTDGFKNMYGE